DVLDVERGVAGRRRRVGELTDGGGVGRVEDVDGPRVEVGPVEQVLGRRDGQPLVDRAVDGEELLRGRPEGTPPAGDRAVLAGEHEEIAAEAGRPVTSGIVRRFVSSPRDW